MIQQIAPAPLAQASVALGQKGPAAWQHAIEDFWHGEPELALAGDETVEVQSSDRVPVWMFLQPYAEYLADHREIAVVDGTPSTCPICGGRPAVGVLRSEGDGAKKSLICMLCAHEWAFRRIYVRHAGKKESRKWRSIRLQKSRTSAWTFATLAIAT